MAMHRRQGTALQLPSPPAGSLALTVKFYLPPQTRRSKIPDRKTAFRGAVKISAYAQRENAVVIPTQIQPMYKLISHFLQEIKGPTQMGHARA